MAVSRLTKFKAPHPWSIGSQGREAHRRRPEAEGPSVFTRRRRRKQRQITEAHKSPPKPKKLIHLIPILSIPCFLVFNLSSHDPSQTDLAQFGGVHRLSMPIGSTETDDFGRFLDMMFWRFGA
ncbi:uncharacterized protein LOC130769817 [Actinidia eriantha]|uniref:uncharacterized protein LOC130769817 n=1 Tax=Actinidia eriantha TaxID=165200 RepID=UPI00258E77BD|nr:uncharacterized protein LOC130769817 [Actinidia eriantha]